MLLILAHQPLIAVNRIELTVAKADAEGWVASDLNLTARLNQDSQLMLEVYSPLLKLTSGNQRLEDIQWRCEQLQQTDAGIACRQGQLTLGKSPLGTANLALGWQLSDIENWHIDLHRLDAPIGRLHGSLSMQQAKWQAQIHGRQLRLDKLIHLLPKTMLPDWSGSGLVSFKTGISGYQGKMQDLSLELQGRQISYTDAQGMQVGENLALGLDLSTRLLDGQWLGKLDLSVDQGQLYSDPIYMSVDHRSLGFHTKFKGQLPQGRLQIHNARLTLPGVVDASIEGQMEQQHWQTMAIEFHAPDLAGFYKVLAQPFLIGSSLDELSVQGSGEGHIRMRHDELIALDIKLTDLQVEDQQNRFGVRQMNADVHWLANGEANPSDLSVASGHLFKVDFGQLEAKMRVADGRLLLMESLSIPLLGGEISLHDLFLDGLSKPPVKWKLAMSAKQIQLDALSSAMDWPSLSGQLDGNIPSVRYVDGDMLLDGKLTLDVFNGSIIVDGLKISDPMSVAPVLETQLRLQDLDLAQLTNTFSFGRIEGLLAGEIDELQLVGWQLNRFKAGVRTPDHDKSRHRISQRAIDNLTSLGTGMSAGLSGTALRMFNDFGYDKITLEVDLAGNMASLDGIPYKDGGYYIVKGAGLPRIDVIGRTHKIAWKDLVSRIQDARFDDMVIQ